MVDGDRQGEGLIQLHNVDCESFMASIPDGHFDITIADPPYGIGKDWKRRRRAAQLYDDSGYDNQRPSRHCIDEIVRVSRRWIIWGWNYFTDILPPTNYLIVWDKMANANQKIMYSKAEIAGTNVRVPCNLVSIPWDGYRMGEETGKKKIHPHQKPVALYRWLLDWYGPGNREDEFFRATVFDPFAGSGSLGVACKERGVFVCWLRSQQDVLRRRVRASRNRQGRNVKYQARQTPKGHTTVWCGDTLVATISGSRFNREQRLDIAKRIAEALSNDKEEK